MKRLSLFLTENQMKWLKHFATLSGLSMSEHIRRAIDAYIREELKMPQRTQATTTNSGIS